MAGHRNVANTKTRRHEVIAHEAIAPSQFHRKDRQARKEHRKGHRTHRNIDPSHHRMKRLRMMLGQCSPLILSESLPGFQPIPRLVWPTTKMRCFAMVFANFAFFAFQKIKR
jgi:hypothetical protein